MRNSAAKQRRFPVPPALLALPWLLAGCGSLQVIPIQMARVGQVELYEQTFDFGELPPKVAAQQKWQRERWLNERIDEALGRMVGTENWGVIKDVYGLAPMRAELVAGDLRIQGHLQTQIYLDPEDHDRFYFEGSGRFFLLRRRTREILLNGDFYIVPQRHRIAQLERGYVDIDVQQIITRIPGYRTHLQRSLVRYRIYIDNSRADDEVYSIDYDRRHDVYLIEDPDYQRTDDAQHIGYLRFDEAHGDAKLLDLRGRGFLRDDYEQLRRR